MMLPPIDETVLKNNPDFERLYNTVTTSLLNPDGSTKSNDPAAKKRDAVRDELKARRLKAAKQHLLRRAIAASASASATTAHEQSTNGTALSKQHQPKQHQSQPLRRTRSSKPSSQQPRPSIPAPPPEILDLLLLLPPFLSNARTMPSSSLAVLLSRPPLSELDALFPQLAATLSTTLSRQAGAVARVLNPHTNPSYIHRTIPTLASTTSDLKASVCSSSRTLSRSRQRATHDLAAHLSQHGGALAQLVRILESKHGPAARSAELRAEEADLETRTWALAAEAVLWDARRAVYPPEARRALVNYRRHLDDARMRLADAVRVREAELADYGVSVAEGEGDEGKERTMREIARVWREMETRLNEVRGDLNRLG